MNAAETKVLIDLAREKKLLLVEGETSYKFQLLFHLTILTGLWTRFFPIVAKFRQLIFEDKVIGDIKHVVSDFAIGRLDCKFFQLSRDTVFG